MQLFCNNRNISLINRAYCMDNPRQHSGYSSLVWGLTASDDPWGYQVHEPNYSDRDNGTITPTAALSAMAYIPEESIATLKHFYYTLGKNLWGPFGFRDAFHPGEQWFSESYIAIDQGTIVPMIENYRSGLCWESFMVNPEIPPMLEKLGWTISGMENSADSRTDAEFLLHSAYPNPFNPLTTIVFQIPNSSRVILEVYDTLGRLVATLVDEPKSAGRYQVTFDGAELSSGVYYYRMVSGSFSAVKKFSLIK